MTILWGQVNEAVARRLVEGYFNIGNARGPVTGEKKTKRRSFS